MKRKFNDRVVIALLGIILGVFGFFQSCKTTLASASAVYLKENPIQKNVSELTKKQEEMAEQFFDLMNKVLADIPQSVWDTAKAFGIIGLFLNLAYCGVFVIIIRGNLQKKVINSAFIIIALSLLLSAARWIASMNVDPIYSSFLSSGILLRSIFDSALLFSLANLVETDNKEKNDDNVLPG